MTIQTLPKWTFRMMTSSSIKLHYFKEAFFSIGFVHSFCQLHSTEWWGVLIFSQDLLGEGKRNRIFFSSSFQSKCIREFKYEVISHKNPKHKSRDMNLKVWVLLHRVSAHNLNVICHISPEAKLWLCSILVCTWMKTSSTCQLHCHRDDVITGHMTLH